MKNILILLFSVFFLMQGILGQEKEPGKLLQARTLLSDYRDASMFERSAMGKLDPARESIFRDCFQTPHILFDIPFSEKIALNTSSNSNSNIESEYLKFVSIDKYLLWVRAIYAQSDCHKIDYEFIETAVDISKLESDSTIVFEIEKRFTDTTWFRQESQRFLFTISFNEDGEPKITSVRLSDPGQVKNEVFLVLDRKGKNTEYGNILTRIKIDFEEDIYDRQLREEFDAAGIINLGFMSNRANIIIDTAYGENGERYTVPSDWKTEGRKVHTQPVGGFRVILNPYTWNGWAKQVWAEAGAVIQSSNNLSNFASDSEFTNRLGNSFGAGATFTKFLNPESRNRGTKNWIYGFGSGISFHYVKYKIESDNFHQNAYAWSDRSGDTCQILISGNSFEETIGSVVFKVPLYAEIGKKINGRFLGMESFSVQAGLNVMIPFMSRFKYYGTFSRHGLYPDYNNQVITDDPFYNYYTNEYTDDSDDLDLQNLIFEGMFRLNAHFQLNKNKSGQSLVVGLVFTTPFTKSNSAETNNYFINSGDDVYHSLALSKEKIYDYYFGISLGFNFIQYKVE